MSGESRLLSGQLGAGRPPDPILGPTLRIAKAAEEAKTQRAKLVEDIAAIRASLTTTPAKKDIN